MVLFDASPIFVAFPNRFPSSSVSGPGGTRTVVSVEDLRGLMDGVTALTSSPPCRNTWEKLEGGPQQTQAPLTHLNAVTR